VKIAPGRGDQVQFGPTIETPGLLTGVAFDSQGRLYVADATFSEEDPPGVLRIAAGQVTRVLTLPADSFPNGLAIRNGSLYVADSALGAVWKAPLNAQSTPQTPWLEDDRLLPEHAIGANGIAFAPNGDLYVAMADAGRVARAPVLANGTAGALRIVLERPQLRTVDGIVFDRRGDLWMTTNGPASGRLLRLTTAGQLLTMVDNPQWLDYPTQPVLGSGRWYGTVFVENGSYETSWTPNVIALSGLVP
jgi:sugar lactone lactonase YvrE